MCKTQLQIRDMTPSERDWLFEALEKHFTDEELGLGTDDLPYFLSSEYREIIERLMNREQDPLRAVRFMAGEKTVGFATYCNYLSEDGKTFILEYNIAREYRRCGFGRRFYELIEQREKQRGAKYAELTSDNAGGFWQKLGFAAAGVNQDGQTLFAKRFD